MATVTRGRSNNGRKRTTERSHAFKVVDDLAAKRHISLLTLSSVAGTNRSNLYSLRNPRLSTIRKLADALGMKPGKLAQLLVEVESDA